MIPVRTGGWKVEPFADLSAAFVFFVDPVRITVLDRLTWYVLELCEGRTESEIVTKVEGLGVSSVPDRTRGIVGERLRLLRERGLLEAAA